MSAITLQKARPATLTIAKQTSGRVVVTKAGGAQVTVIRQGGSAPLAAATANTLGGVIVGANLSVTANGVLSANIPSVSSDWANITSKPTTLAGYGITDAVKAIANITYASAIIPKYAATGSNRTLAGDIAVSGNTTSYAGFEIFASAPILYTAGQTRIAGTDFQQGEFRAGVSNVLFAVNRYTLNSSGVPVAQVGKTEFSVSNNGFTATTFDNNSNQALLLVTATGSAFDAGAAGILELTGDDVTVQTNQVEPGPFSVLNRMMADQLYLQVVRKN